MITDKQGCHWTYNQEEQRLYCIEAEEEMIAAGEIPDPKYPYKNGYGFPDYASALTFLRLQYGVKKIVKSSV